MAWESWERHTDPCVAFITKMQTAKLVRSLKAEALASLFFPSLELGTVCAKSEQVLNRKEE